MINTWGTLSITAWWPVRVVVLALGAVAVVAAVRALRRPASPVVRACAVLAAVLLALLTLGGVVNAHYAYVPTLGEALGDESSISSADGVDGRIPARGQVEPLTVPPTASNFSARQAEVYLPPAWFATQRPALPVIMLMHGEPGDPSDWADGGEAAATADAWAAQHRGVAPVLVMPRGVESRPVEDTVADFNRQVAELKDFFGEI